MSMSHWITEQEDSVRAMDDAELERELAFAEGFAPATTTLEQTWLEALREERARRSAD